MHNNDRPNHEAIYPTKKRNYFNSFSFESKLNMSTYNKETGLKNFSHYILSSICIKNVTHRHKMSLGKISRETPEKGVFFLQLPMVTNTRDGGGGGGGAG